MRCRAGIVGIVVMGFSLSACNPLAGGESKSTFQNGYQPGLPQTPGTEEPQTFTSNWSFDALKASTLYSYLDSLVEFVGGVVRLKPADQIDNSTYGFGAMDGASFTGVAWDANNLVLRLSDAGSCDATSTNCWEFDESWTPEWDNLIGYWKLNGSIGSIVSGATIAATVGPNGSMSGTGASYGNGKMNQGIEFTGSTAIDAGNPASFSGLTQVSAQAWVYIPSNWSVSNYQLIIDKCCSPSHMISIQTVSSSSTVMEWGVVTSVTGQKFVNIADFSKLKGGWHYIVGTYDGSESKAYLDGVLQNSAAVTGTLATTLNDIGIGGRANGSYGFTSYIDEVAVWKTALSADEVATIYARQSAQYAGTFTSRVMDGFSTGQSWTSLAWTSTLPFYKALPDGGASESQASYASLVDATTNPGLSKNLMDGVVGLWHLNEPSWNGSSGEVNDNSGSGVNGISVGGASTVSGLLGNAGNFNGSSYVNLGTYPYTNAEVGVGSISAWFKLAKLGSTMTIFDIAGILGSQITTSAGKTVVQTRVYPSTAVGSTSLAVGVWYHYVETWDGSTAKVYLNGKLENSVLAGSLQPDSYNTRNVSIGQSCSVCSSTYFSGQIDEVALWGRVLSSDEILELYRRGANRILYQIKSCADSDCLYKDNSSTPATWIGPDGTNQTYFSELQNTDSYNSASSSTNGAVLVGLPSLDLTKFGSGLSSALSTNRYFRYRMILESDDANNLCDYGAGANTAPCSPELKQVAIGPAHYSKDSPTVVSQTGVDFESLSAFTETLGSSCAGGIGYNLSRDGASWYYWTGTAWGEANGTVAQSSDASTIHGNIGTFATQVGQGNVYFKAFFKSDGEQPCELDQLQISGQR